MATAPFPLSTPIAYKVIEYPASAADFVTAVIDAMLSAGWTVQTVIPNGVQLLGTSPQGYSVFLNLTLFTSLGTNWLSVQLLSAAGSGATGYEYLIGWDPTKIFQVIAHPCGGAISQLNEASNPNGSIVIFGIPQVATKCGVATALGAINEVWFSFGDYVSSPFNVAETPRTNIDVNDYDGAGEIANQIGCINGVIAPLNTSKRWDTPEILRFSSLAVDAGVNSSHPLFFGSDEPMTYPAFIGWPAVSLGAILERGQVYNALVVGVNQPMNDLATIAGYSFINFTNDYFWGGLWLLQGTPGGTGNYAY